MVSDPPSDSKHSVQKGGSKTLPYFHRHCLLEQSPLLCCVRRVNITAQLPFASAACAGVLAIAGLIKAQRSASRWSFAAGMAVLAAESLCTGRVATATSPELIVQWQIARLLVLSFLPGVWLLFGLSYAREAVRKLPTKWRLTLAAALILPVGFTFALKDQLVHAVRDGESWVLRLSWPGVTLHLFLLVGAVLVLRELERTFRASVGTMRWRIKFMLMGVGILFVVRVYTSCQALLFSDVDPLHQIINSGALLLAAALILRSFFRAGHFDLEVYPSQLVIQNSLTVFLAGIYLLIVGVFAKVVARLGGDAGFALKTFVALISLVALALLLQSDRVRLALRQFVSRHFQRPLYDYRTVWKKFTEGTASRMEQSDLCRSLVRLVADVFQSLSVSIWLVDEKNRTLVLAASTSQSDGARPEAESEQKDARELITHFQSHPEPAEIETATGNWAATLRRWHPAVFPNGGSRVCLPIVSRGEILGLITLGDRVGGAAFTLQDFDLLKCAGDHAAASLLNVQLSQKLLQAKELEAFQTMAAFFVHDLKNAASTLNLMLQNLPVHFDDPAFREDALRGVSKTVTHINRLIGRLSLLRHEQKIQPAPADLNDVVTEAIAGLESGPDFTLEKELSPLAKIPFDREQIAKVVTNLVLNARESSPAKAHVRIVTSQSAEWVAVAVTDHGCGMSAEFIKNSLFRPFQTSKKTGLGIGLFQSKMIVEAHGGRLTVASEPGRGTTFQVLLPIPSPAT